MTPTTSSSNHTAKLIFSFAAIYIIWGTTYLAMRIAVESMPPFLMAGSRFLFSGTLFYLVLRWKRVAHPTWAQWKSAAIVGCLLFLGGNGLVTWAEQEIPSGIAALVIATMPMWMTFFDWLLFRGPKPSGKIVFGLALGLAGIVLLIGPGQLQSGETKLNLAYMGGLMCAPIFWSIGSLYSRKADLPPNIFMTNAAEMLCGGAVLALVSLFFAEPFNFRLGDVTFEAWMCLAYLTVFGSMVALSAYTWLLKNAAAAKIATYSYVNPVIAVFLGWLILSEEINLNTVLAVIVIVGGVILIVTDRPNKKPVNELKALKSSVDPDE